MSGSRRSGAFGMGDTAARHELCAVAPHPRLRERINDSVTGSADDSGPLVGQRPDPRRPGFNDGVILPADRFPRGTSVRAMRRAAADRAPLRGQVRVAVVLVEFPDAAMGAQASRFEELFFSTGELATGSVTEYYREVTGGLVEIVGEVVGPLMMPNPVSWYANGNYGIGNPTGEPRANVMAADAAKLADAVLDLTPYDNDGNGYVDAFVVVHAGRGGEETGDPNDIWSHKWTLPAEYVADGTRVFAYLTIPEDAKLGVSAHELGHLLFGFPDLYDTDYTSEGVGDWCLMAGGSWNGGGDTPAHPSAWCKAQQGWADVVTVTADGPLELADVKQSRQVHRLWTGGASGSEYFLVENRQQTGYDAMLPGGGLLVWHVDDAQQDNTDENHYLVGLLQADGLAELENAVNRGDGGDCWPGSTDARTLDATTTPSTLTYAGLDSGVRLHDVSDPGVTMTVTVSVSGVDDPADDVAGLARRLHAAEQRITALEEALAMARDAFSGVGAAGAGAAAVGTAGTAAADGVVLDLTGATARAHATAGAAGAPPGAHRAGGASGGASGGDVPWQDLLREAMGGDLPPFVGRRLGEPAATWAELGRTLRRIFEDGPPWSPPPRT